MWQKKINIEKFKKENNRILEEDCGELKKDFFNIWK